MRDRVAIVTPWYPTVTRPFHGSFVRGFADTVHHELKFGVDVLHLDAWGLPAGRPAQARVLRDLERLVGDPLRFPDGDEPRVRHVPAPVRPSQEFGPIADEQRRYLARVLHGRRLPHDVVHAHVGLGGGWPALEACKPGGRFFVTEHATFLERLFTDAEALRHYGEVIARCTAFLCVSALLRDQVVGRFPQHADRVFVIPNPIDFDRLPPLVEEQRVPRRWLYAGSLTKRKGVRRLLEAFATALDRYPDLTLTMVGDGPEHDALTERVAELQLSDVVSLPGPVPSNRMAETYAQHDLLVHLSAYETFGMTLVEAVATGIPVLATRSGGPDETIAPIEEAVGRLVAVDASPTEVADAYGSLREGLHDLRVREGREELRAQYGTAAIAKMLARLYEGEGAT